MPVTSRFHVTFERQSVGVSVPVRHSYLVSYFTQLVSGAIVHHADGIAAPRGSNASNHVR